jgi:hypothetical protein
MFKKKIAVTLKKISKLPICICCMLYFHLYFNILHNHPHHRKHDEKFEPSDPYIFVKTPLYFYFIFSNKSAQISAGPVSKIPKKLYLLCRTYFTKVILAKTV